MFNDIKILLNKVFNFSSEQEKKQNKTFEPNEWKAVFLQKSIP